MSRLALCLVLAGLSLPAAARNWQLALETPLCDAAGTMTFGASIRYLGAKAPVESPVVRLVGADGKARLPRGLLWKRGSKTLAALMVTGGVRGLGAGEAAEVQLRFAVADAAGPLRLEFGDLPAVALTRKGRGCQALAKAPFVAAASRPAPADASKLRIYRSSYPCGRPPAARKTMEADHPPYLPRQLLVLGRGYLPNVRHIDLPMGKAPAQAYFYAGADTLVAIEQAARRAIGADFPAFVGGGSFAFNWGEQRGATGNQIDSIGLYELRACPGAQETQKKKGA